MVAVDCGLQQLCKIQISNRAWNLSDEQAKGAAYKIEVLESCIFGGCECIAERRPNDGGNGVFGCFAV